MSKRIVVILAAGLLVAADRPKEEAKDEKRILGKWKPASSVRNGKPVDLKGWQVTFDAEKMTFVRPGGKESQHPAYKLDPTQVPKAIDLKMPKGAEEWGLGIYSLEGDTLKLCTAVAGADRPAEFTSKPGSRWTLTVFERVKSK